MISVELKKKTRKIHRRIEQNVCFSELLEAPTVENYTLMLTCLYGIYKGYQPVVYQYFPEFEMEWKKHLIDLKKDLMGLGMTCQAISELPVLSLEKSDVLHAYGVAYVLEGSTLGGQAISGHLEKFAVPEIFTNSRFYFGLKKRANLRWQFFLNGLNEKVFDKSTDREKILQAAVTAFRKVQQCIEERQSEIRPSN